MKFIKSSFEILEQDSDINGIYKQIEKAGRLSYKSEDKIVDGSAEKFVDMLIKRGHTSVLEHGTVYLHIPKSESYGNTMTKYLVNPYSVVRNNKNDYFITTNYRVLINGEFGINWLGDLKYLCSPTEFHEKRITVKFVLPISISREFVRHRVFSFMEQSTRYCNYNSDKFNNELTFIIPYWADMKEARYVYWDDDWMDGTDRHAIPTKILKHNDGDTTDIFISQCQTSELTYREIINSGMKAQEVREILPLCTKTELIMTGTVSQWEEFFKLRTDRAAHPQARELAVPLKEEFIKRGYIVNQTTNE